MHTESATPVTPSRAVWATRARDTYGALLGAFGVRRALRRPLLLRERVPDGPRYAYVWPYSQALAATNDLIELAAADDSQGTDEGNGAAHEYQRDLDDRLAGLAHYWDAHPAVGRPGYDSAPLPPYGDGGDKFYDDNAWIALELLRIYQRTSAPSALQRACEVFGFLRTGWAGDTGDGSAPGGVYWKQQTPRETCADRNTCSTAPAAQVALRLYQATHDATYRAWARRMLAWLDATLRDTDGLFRDHISPGKRIDATKWSYNQGTVIGVNALLAALTGEEAALDRAEALAAAALRYYGWRDGSFVSDALFFRQDAIFNALLYRNLRLVDRLRPHPGYRAAFAAYAEALWGDPARWRATATGRLVTPGAARPGQATLLDQAAMVSLAALLALG